MTGNDKNAPEATMPVQCRICEIAGIENKVARKALIGHLGAKHKSEGWTKDRYIETWQAERAEDDFWFWVNTPAARQEQRNTMLEINLERKQRSGINGALDSLLSENRDGLNPDEQDFYDQFFEQIIQQTDRDESQMPQIASLAFDHVIVKRLRNRLLGATKKNAKIDDIIAAGEIEKSIKTTEERVAKTMTALGISREAQLKRGAIIKSTPASLISGYLDEIERMSPEMLDALQLEEKRVYAQMMPRIEKFILSEAPELEKEDESDAASGKPLSLDEALSRAGIVAGGSIREAPQSESLGDIAV